MPQPARHIYVATLGGQPQVVTLALDRLLARNLPIEETIVVHLAPRTPRHQTALDRLASEFSPFASTRYMCPYRPQVVHNLAHPVDDLNADPAITAVCQTFHTLFNRLKQQYHTIHLCVSGGRRLLGILALSVAPFYFGYDDRVWHLHSSDAVQQQTRDGAVMHLPLTADARLLELSLFPGGRLLPTLPPDPVVSTPSAAVDPFAIVDSQEQQRCLRVWHKLTPKQRGVLRAFAQGRNIQDVMNTLHISSKTVDSHKTVIYAECRIVWELPDGKPDHYSWLYRVFHPFLADLV